jgi:hypothetical protein
MTGVDCIRLTAPGTGYPSSITVACTLKEESPRSGRLETRRQTASTPSRFEGMEEAPLASVGPTTNPATAPRNHLAPVLRVVQLLLRHPYSCANPGAHAESIPREAAAPSTPSHPTPSMSP